MRLVKEFTPPKYVIDGVEYNEYEVREIQALIAEGKIPFEMVCDLTITEVGSGNVQYFRTDGRMHGEGFEGFKITNDLVYRIIVAMP